MPKKKLVAILIAIGVLGIGLGIGTVLSRDDSGLGGTTGIIRDLIPTSTTATGVTIPASYRPANFRNLYIQGSATTTQSFTVGSLTAGSCDVKSDTNGLLYCGTDASGASAGAAWEKYSVLSSPANIITPTTTNASIYVSGNATTTGSVTFSGYTTCSLETDGNGLITCGTDETGSSVGAAWEQIWTNAITPTSTSAGIFVNASSTFNSTLRINGDATTTGHLAALGGNSDQWNTAFGWGNHASAGYFSAANFASSWADQYNATTTLNGFTPSNYLLTANFGNQFAASYNATTTLNGFTPSNYLLTANFDTEWNSDFNATSTWTAFDANWARNSNATTTWGGFQGEFNKYLNATSTLDLDTLVVNTSLSGTGFTNAFNSALNATTTLDLTTLQVANITNFFGADCSAGNYVYGINTNGTLDCREDTTGVGSVGSPGAWETAWTNALTPTSTTAGIFINASSTFDSTLRTNGQILGKNGTNSSPTYSFGSESNTGMYWRNSNSIGFTLLGVLEWYIDDNNGNWITPSGAQVFSNALGSAAVPAYGFNRVGDELTGIYSPSTGVVGLGTAGVGRFFVGNASSTFATNLTVSGNASTTGYLLVNATPSGFNPSAGDLLVGGSATTTGNLTIKTLTAENCDIKADTNGLLYCGTDANSGGGGGAAWEQIWTNAITPTTTTAGIFVNASSTINSTLRVNNDLILKAGSNSDPSLHFGDSTTGFYRSAANRVGFASQGTLVWFWDDSGVLNSNGSVLYGFAGAADTPGYSFGTDPDTGVFGKSANVLGLSAGGNAKALFGTASSTITTSLNLSGNATTTGSLALTAYNCSTFDNGGVLTADANGLIVCQNDDAGAGGGSPGAWQTFATNVLTPTSSSASILVNGASSTITNLVTNKATSTIAMWIGSAGIANTIDLSGGDLYIQDDLEVDSVATIGSNLYVGYSANNDDDYVYFDVTGEYLVWDDNPGLFILTDDLEIQGYASSTTGITINGLFVVNNTGIATSTNIVANAVFKFPFGSAPATDDAGETAIDQTSGQIQYHDGTAERAIPFTYERSFTMASTTFVNFDSIPLWRPHQAVTVTDIFCETDGGTSVQVTLGDGTNNMDTITCDEDGAADDGSIANNTFTADERMEVDFGTVSGAVNWVNVNVTYSVTPD